MNFINSMSLLLASDEAIAAAQESASWLAFLAFGTFTFWFVTLFAVGILFYLLSRDDVEDGATAAGVVFGLFLLFLQFIAGVDIYGTVAANPLMAGLIVVGYIGIGVCWSAFRFWWEISSCVQTAVNDEKSWMIDKLQNHYMRFDDMDPSKAKEHAEFIYKTGELPDEVREAWNGHIDSVIPHVSERKAFIITTCSHLFVVLGSFFAANW